MGLIPSEDAKVFFNKTLKELKFIFDDFVGKDQSLGIMSSFRV